jgi:hypothetical protein
MSFGQRGSCTPSKDSEFRCPRCRARCTESPTKDLEYGHAQGCPDRPDELRRYVDGSPYDPSKDKLAPDPDEVAADGGDRRVD